MRVRRGIRSEREAVLLGGVAEIVEHHARLDPRAVPVGIEVVDPAEELAAVDHDGRVAALTGETRATAAREERCVVPRHTARPCTMSSTVRGTKTPSGSCR